MIALTNILLLKALKKALNLAIIDGSNCQNALEKVNFNLIFWKMEYSKNKIKKSIKHLSMIG